MGCLNLNFEKESYLEYRRFRLYLGYGNCSRYFGIKFSVFGDQFFNTEIPILKFLKTGVLVFHIYFKLRKTD